MLEGVFCIWGLFYSGLFNDFFGEDVVVIEFLMSCYEFFDNFLMIICGFVVDGGVFFEVGGIDIVYICFGGNVFDFVVVFMIS